MTILLAGWKRSIISKAISNRHCENTSHRNPLNKDEKNFLKKVLMMGVHRVVMLLCLRETKQHRERG